MKCNNNNFIPFWGLFCLWSKQLQTVMKTTLGPSRDFLVTQIVCFVVSCVQYIAQESSYTVILMLISVPQADAGTFEKSYEKLHYNAPCYPLIHVVLFSLSQETHDSGWMEALFLLGQRFFRYSSHRNERFLGDFFLVLFNRNMYFQNVSLLIN